MSVSMQPNLYPNLTPMEPAIQYTQGKQSIVPITHRALSAAEHEKTQELVKLSAQIANQVLKPTSQETTSHQAETSHRANVHVPQMAHSNSGNYTSGSYNYSAPSYNILSPVTHQHSHHHYTQIDTRTEKERKDDDMKNKQFWAALAGIVVTLGGAYFFGKYLAQGETSGDERVPFDRLTKKWEDSRTLYSEKYQETVDVIAEKTQRILNRKQSNDICKTAFAVSAIVSGLLLVTGGIAASPALMATGLVLLTVTGAAALFNWAYRSYSDMDSRDAKSILENKEKLDGIRDIARNSQSRLESAGHSNTAAIETVNPGRDNGNAAVDTIAGPDANNARVNPTFASIYPTL